MNSDKAEDGGENLKPDAGGNPEPSHTSKRRSWLQYSVFFLILLVAFVFHRCQKDPVPLPLTPPERPSGQAIPAPAKPETLVAPEPAPITSEPIKPTPLPTLPKAKIVDTVKPRVLVPVDSTPYLWADPWGGRHFDSVRVTLHCREGCLILYALDDSVNFKSYDMPLVFKRNVTLFISGVDSLNRQAPAVRVDYVIERNPGACAGNSMPISSTTANQSGGTTPTATSTPLAGKTGTVCMDLYEWPDSNGAVARAFVTRQEAADSCKSVGKRLCTASEWRDGCQGPDKDPYPYGTKYHENHCPAKEAAAARSGRFPVCRSYYGLFDMTGNLWEWTATPAPDSDFFMVAGGNWTAGNQATCGHAKFSFYPSVRYPFVGFRCCQDVPGR